VNRPTNTPPDGDFVRYIERLAAGKVAPGSQGPVMTPQKAVPGAAPLAIDFGRTPPVAGQDMPAGISFAQHVKWAIGLWLATQLLARFVPGAGLWFVPVLALYAAWVIYSLIRKPSGAFIQALSEWASRKAQKIRKDPDNRE